MTFFAHPDAKAATEEDVVKAVEGLPDEGDWHVVAAAVPEREQLARFAERVKSGGAAGPSGSG